MAWTKEPPIIPEEGSESVYYWYYDIKEKLIWPTEVYYGCWKLHTYDGLWWDEKLEPPEGPPIEKPVKKLRRKRNDKSIRSES